MLKTLHGERGRRNHERCEGGNQPFEDFGNIQSERLNRDSDAYARKVADNKIKAFKTNLARQAGD